MQIISFLILALHMYYVFHAMRRGLDKWAIAILMLPIIGLTAYLIKEVWPIITSDFSQTKSELGFSAGSINRRELKRLEDQLELSDSVNNRKALAEGYVKAGNYDGALRLFESCLNGVHKDDPAILEGIAIANFLKEDFQAARESLEKHREVRGNIKSHQSNLLLARTHEALGEAEEALQVYSEIANQYPGEEARCRYALLLKQMGRTAEAQTVFEDLLRNVKLSPDYYQRAQRRWTAIAKKEKLKSKVSM